MERRENSTSGLTRGEGNRGMRSFVTANGIWGVWGQCVGVGTAVFTGYALMLGADDSFIALLSSCALLLGTVQLISPLLGSRVRSKKKLILGLGIGEVFWRCSTILIPLLFLPSAYLPALGSPSRSAMPISVEPFFSWDPGALPSASPDRFTAFSCCSGCRFPTPR